MKETKFQLVTELPGGGVSREQLDRFYLRYAWARTYCRGKDVVEVGCGGGQGLGLLAKVASSVVAGDIDQANVDRAKVTYENRISIDLFRAEKLPFESCSKDVVIFFEALYYLDDVRIFLKECLRVLKPNGLLLISSTNPELFDFTPSIFSKNYYSVRELNRLLADHGLNGIFFGDTSLVGLSLKGAVLRFLKTLATKLGLVPTSMKGKAVLRHLAFGRLLTMPSEVTDAVSQYAAPPVISQYDRCTLYKGYFCAAQKQSGEKC